MTIIKHIPNTITCMNILCGCLAIFTAFQGELIYASYFVILGAIFDFFDGFAARLLNAMSPIGKDLDSLADIVSFCAAPAFITIRFIQIHVFNNATIDELSIINTIILFSPIFIVALGAVRLAKFNIDTRQSSSFIGLPVPAAAIFFISFPIIAKYSSIEMIQTINSSLWYILPMILLFSLLMVSEIPMFSLKIKNLSWKDNKIRYIYLIIIVLLASTIGIMALPLTIVVFILLSILQTKL